MIHASYTSQYTTQTASEGKSCWNAGPIHSITSGAVMDLLFSLKAMHCANFTTWQAAQAASMLLLVPSPNLVAQMTATEMQPARISPCPPDLRLPPRARHTTVVIPFEMMSCAPFRTIVQFPISFAKCATPSGDVSGSNARASSLWCFFEKTLCHKRLNSRTFGVSTTVRND